MFLQITYFAENFQNLWQFLDCHFLGETTTLFLTNYYVFTVLYQHLYGQKMFPLPVSFWFFPQMMLEKINKFACHTNLSLGIHFLVIPLYSVLHSDLLSIKPNNFTHTANLCLKAILLSQSTFFLFRESIFVNLLNSVDW